MTERIVVVGASLSGLRTVQGLRRKGSTAAITVVGDESGLPYDRPPLSKTFLLGKADEQSIQLLDAAALALLDLELKLGVSADRLDTDARQVHLSDGLVIGFDTLVIATGSSPRTVPGIESRTGIHTMRTLDDARRIQAGLHSAASVAIVGGGFIGAEIASASREMGVDVTVIDALPTLMTRGLGNELGDRMSELHRRHGVDLRLGCMVTGFAGDDHVTGVELADGAVVAADLVVVGIGTVPNVGWLRSSGLTLDDGVVCDEYLKASDGIYAVGDVARWRNPRYGEPMRTEHWTSAGEQATALSSTLTGTPTPCAVVPYVWSDQFGKRLQIFGRIGADDDIDIVFEDADRFVATARRLGRLEGVVAYGALKEMLPYRAELMAAPLPTRSP
ncbi:MAG TPA: FAD-dependent oxidoreductase [Acidothermaceae bacterium]|jgi:NADPH-dependent 2,4-dienoyl-CoA reductase/sulfur reductase-like enzyme|nr:FAD-dependent oxidoreductase [Acidothermaceae bacterium]